MVQCKLLCASGAEHIHENNELASHPRWCGRPGREGPPVNTCDVLVIGGGVIGISIAREIRRRRGAARVVVLEKETALAQHASGRNSGVLHAGFYYSADSLKAKMTRAGNQALTAYCEEKRIPLNRCGKLVVAQDESELATLDELLRRGRVNGVPLEAIGEEDARRIEPRVRTLGRALFSPSTSAVDPARVLAALADDARAEGIELRLGTAYLGRRDGDVQTTAGRLSAGYVVNAAGLQADRIARDFGFAQHHRILPFKGLYLYSDEPPGAVRTNIYPVPNLRNPFLGVHFTVTADGHAKIGPTAIPAFWREQYTGWENFRLDELGEILLRQAGLLFFSGFDFPALALEELHKYSRRYLVSLAARMMTGVALHDYRRWGRPGIRAQLLDLRTRKLEMDFHFEHDARSLHVLNAVSPGFTCAMPFASHLCDRMPL
ncbi:MAG: L-2-hydroxyglutarate oxidase [Candidatus Lambdaproteobacteria bacterium]|nr:L-2-hydroxyglutarate oxidase [Candidatus Lambdaproteobacteria bacterium]